MTKVSPISWYRRPALRRSLAALVAGLVFSNCGGGSDGPTAPPPAAVASVQLSGLPAENVVLTGATAQLAAQPRAAGGAALDRTVTWSSSSLATATVSNTGLVTGVAPGPVTITATSDGVQGSVVMSIRSPISVPPASAGAPVTTTTLGGAVTLTIPPAATTTTTTLTVAPAAAPPADNRLVAGSTFDFGPSGTTFTTPITLELAFNPALVPEPKRADLRIYLVETGGALTLVPGGSVDLVNNQVEAPITHFSTYTVVQQPDPTQISVSAGNNQSATFSTTVATAPSVLVQDAQNRPVAFADVQFAVATGDGFITGQATAETDANGIATLPGTWTLGPTPGANTLTATIVGTGITTTVTATATAPATQLAITTAPQAATSFVPFSVTVQLRDQFGNVVPTATDAVSVAISSGTGTLSGTTTRAAANGVVTFDDLRVRGVGTHRLEFTASALTGAVTGDITVTQTVTAMIVTTQPPVSSVSAAVFSTQPVLELRDVAGDLVLGATNAVTASRGVGTGVLFGTTTVNAVDGVVTFTDLGIEGSGLHDLTFASAGVQGATSNGIDITLPPPGVIVKVGASPTLFVAEGAQLVVPILVDLSNRGDDDLASVSLTITWDPAMFDYVSNAAGVWNDDGAGAASVVINDGGTASGSLGIAGFTTGATTSSFTLRTITLQARSPVTQAQGAVGATIGAAGNAAGSAITVTPRQATVTITTTP